MSDGGRSAHKGKSEPMARVDAKAAMSARRPLALTRERCGVRTAATGRHAARAGLASPTTGRAGLACFRLSATSCGPRQPQPPCAGRGPVARAGKVRRCLRLADCVRSFFRRQNQSCGQNQTRSPTGGTLSEVSAAGRNSDHRHWRQFDEGHADRSILCRRCTRISINCNVHRQNPRSQSGSEV